MFNTKFYVLYTKDNEIYLQSSLDMQLRQQFYNAITANKFVWWYFHCYLYKSQMGCCMFKQFLYGFLDNITSESFVVHYTYVDAYQYSTRDWCTLKIMGRFLHNIRFRQFLFLSSFLIPVDVAFFLSSSSHKNSLRLRISGGINYGRRPP